MREKGRPDLPGIDTGAVVGHTDEVDPSALYLNCYRISTCIY